MSEYIDKEALIKTTEETPFTMSMFCSKDECSGANMARLTLAAIFKTLPAADVVEVVRCRECKWYQESKLLAPTKFCFRLEGKDGEKVGYNFADDDFCSHGERKGGVNDDHNEMGQNCTIAETM